ncbi:hypothetical protein USB125703_00526 [Pseudoclavibacter triregionum]|nr:hypothetical protein USB125703_00526 [Pseudoclavibacter triregionum]
MPALEPVLERLLPAKLGGPFRRVFASSLAGNLGDGLLLSAGPLLVARLTPDPLLISLAPVASQLPWIALSLFAGILADRMPRVRLMVLASTCRALVLGGLVALLLTGALTIPLLYLALFALGAALPYGAAGVTTLLALWAIAGLRMPEHRDETTGSMPVGGAIARVRRELGSGFRWLWGHAAIRSLAIILFAFNITFGMTWGVLVVYAKEVLGLDAAGYGLLMTASAIGGLLGTACYGMLERRFSYAGMMRTLLCVEVLVHLGFALTTSWAVAAAILFVFGAYGTIWGTISGTIRGRAVPSRMRGRVSSVYLLGMFGGTALGSPLGGLLAQQAGVTTTMWWAGIGTAVVLAIVWRMIPAIGAAGEHGPEDEAATPDSVA